jgi:Dolichyl-phosphate-mannose-protein mannosyltransferase
MPLTTDPHAPKGAYSRHRERIDVELTFPRRSTQFPRTPKQRTKNLMLKTALQKRATSIAAVSLLVLMAVLAGGAARRESITFDEVAHIGAGVSSLQKLDLRMNLEHPPLAKALAAIPLVIRRVKADYSNVSWSFSDSGFFKQYMGEWVFGHLLIATWNDPYTTVLWARVPMLLLTLLLGLLLYIYGASLGGPSGGLLCLCAYATMPAFLAFGPLVLTDTVITLFCLLTLWTFADMWRSPSPGTIWKFGLALGAALLTKFSAGLLFFCFVAFILSLRWRGVSGMPASDAKAELRTWRRRRWSSLMQGTLLAGLVIYVTYLLLSWNQPTGSFSAIPHFPASPFLRRLLMPVWLFLQGLFTFAVTASRPTFILGHSYPHGEWFYFPILFCLKSPLAFLALVLLAVAVAVAARLRLAQPVTVPPEMELHWRAAWTFLLVFTAFCMLSRLTISIRHFLMPLVLIILLLAPMPRLLGTLRRSGWRPATVAIGLAMALSLLLITTAVRAYPHYMPFLNSLSMGRPNYELVNDSNLDWNQSLPEVEQWVQRRGLPHVLIDEYGFFDPRVYVPQAEFWNCQQPAATDGGQWAVVSAGSILDAHNCRWLLRYPQETLAGGSMYAFQLPASIPEAGTADGPPLPADRRNIGGMPIDFNQIFITCIRDPQQLQPIWDHYTALFKAQAEAQARARKKK